MMQMSEISGDAAKHEITAMHYCYALLLCIIAMHIAMHIAM